MFSSHGSPAPAATKATLQLIPAEAIKVDSLGLNAVLNL
jgi:hypothetical protein